MFDVYIDEGGLHSFWRFWYCPFYDTLWDVGRVACWPSF